MSQNIDFYHIKKMEQLGEIIKIKRGLYRIVGEELFEEVVEASHIVPNGVLCLLSALAYHDLTTSTPGQHQFGIARGGFLLDLFPPIARCKIVPFCL